MKVMHVQRQHSMFDTQLTSNPGYKKIQNYVLDLGNILGVGNFSKVYKGHHQLSNQSCAIKVVEIERMKTPALIKLLESQCQILKILKHPNILNCIQIFTSKNNCYIITDLCNQGDLQSLIRKRGPLDQSQARKIIYQTFNGLKYLSEMKIIHRDFKVANVFLNDGVAKIADFGFARKLKYPDQVFTDINIGSPIYMSPQSLLNNRYGPKTDVWAFGVFLYQILHGDTPLYFCKTQMDLKAHIGIPIKQSILSPRLSAQLKNLIFRCLEVDERKRISMAEMSNHPYIIQLKQQFEGINHNHNLTLKISESTTANSRLQVLQKPQGRSKITSFINIHPEPQNSPLNFSIKAQNTLQSFSPSRNTLLVPVIQPQGMKSPQHILRHKNQESLSSQSEHRISVRSHSVDNTPSSVTNTLTTRVLTPLQVIDSTQNTPNSSSRQMQPSQLMPFSSTNEIQPTNIINSSITFAQCVHILHYCRLVYKCITLALKQNCHLDSNVHLSNWLLSMLKQIGNKKDRVKFDGERASVREKKLNDVIHQYQSKYMKQLIQYISNNPILNGRQMKQKIKQQILTLAKIVEAQGCKNQEMVKLLMHFDFLREATSLLNECIDRQDFSTFGVIKIQDFLGKRPDTQNMNLESIKTNAIL